MNRLLPQDFKGKKYGLTYRLVNEGDAEYIHTLRSNPSLSHFIHISKGDVRNQVEWIRQYKKREAEGVDYYFIFFKSEIPIGLNRLYSIHGKTFTAGSWVMTPNLPMEDVLAVPLITREIAFEQLGMEFEDSYDGVNVDNKKVLKFNKLFGCKFLERKKTNIGDFVPMTLTKEDFEANKLRLIKMLNLDNNNE